MDQKAKLLKCLQEHKKRSLFTNEEISEMVDVPKKEVKRWFNEVAFTLPKSLVWEELKSILEITTDEFDYLVENQE